MVFAPENAEVVFRVLVAVLHLDHVTRQMRFASVRQISFVSLSLVAAFCGRRAGCDQTEPLRLRGIAFMILYSFHLTRAARLPSLSHRQARVRGPIAQRPPIEAEDCAIGRVDVDSRRQQNPTVRWDLPPKPRMNLRIRESPSLDPGSSSALSIERPAGFAAHGAGYAQSLRAARPR